MKVLIFLCLMVSNSAWGWRCNVPASTTATDASRDHACVEGLLQRMIANVKFEIARKYTTFLANAQGNSGDYNLKKYDNRRKFDDLLNELKAYLELQKLNSQEDNS